MNDYESQSKKLLENLEGKLIGEYLINNMDTESNQKSYPLGIALIDLMMVFMTWRFDIFSSEPFFYKMSIFSASTEKDMILIPYILLVSVGILHIALLLFQRKNKLLLRGNLNLIAISAVIVMLIFRLQYISSVLFMLMFLVYVLFFFLLRKKSNNE